MIATEDGLIFRRDGVAWRCREQPELLMYAGGFYRVEADDKQHQTAREALAARRQATARDMTSAAPTGRKPAPRLRVRAAVARSSLLVRRPPSQGLKDVVSVDP